MKLLFGKYQIFFSYDVIMTSLVRYVSYRRAEIYRAKFHVYVPSAFEAVTAKVRTYSQKKIFFMV